jgi:trans-aconitate 2-methyltransferase
MGDYAFGDTTAAARRLALVAELFEPASRAFLERVADWRPGLDLDLAVDLGCGPGHTTRLLASVLRPRRTLGLDQSAAFVALASAGAPSGVGFAVHDVTTTPFPQRPAGLAFCRLLLTHLADPAAALGAWATQLAPGGLLLVEEVEAIRTGHPALRGYLDTVAALLAARGHRLEVGPLLDRLPDPPGLVRRDSRVAPLLPPAGRVAEMFGLNLAVWRDDAYRAGVAGECRLDRLAEDLAALARQTRPAEIVWGLRQIVFEQVA